MKQKKMVALFKAIEDISKRKPNEVYVQKSDMQYNFADGKKSPVIYILPTKGKYMLPEVQIIKDIVTSIEPVKLVKEVMNINKAAKFPVMVIMRAQDPHLMILNVNTAYGAVSFMVYVNPNENVDIPDDADAGKSVTAPVSDKELQILKQYVAANS
jgi:hypothetical protein